MKKVLFIAASLLVGVMASAQFSGIQRGQQTEPLPEGFKPSSCNTFLSQYPAVNSQTRQAMFRVVASTAHKVQVDLAGKRYDMTKNEKGIWTCISDPQVVGFHYYSIWIDSVAVMDRNTEAFFGSNWESSGIEIPEGPEGDYYRFNKNIPQGQVRSICYWSEINGMERHCNKSFRTKTDRLNRAMAGLSRGGMQTTTTVFNNMDKFAWMGTFSGFFMGGMGPRPAAGAAQAPSISQQIETAFNGVFKDAAAFDKQINLLFISTGTEERNPKETVEALKTHGIKHIVFHESQGTAHEWLTWRRALNDFAPIIFK